VTKDQLVAALDSRWRDVETRIAAGGEELDPGLAGKAEALNFAWELAGQLKAKDQLIADLESLLEDVQTRITAGGEERGPQLAGQAEGLQIALTLARELDDHCSEGPGRAAAAPSARRAHTSSNQPARPGACPPRRNTQG
jgi:hypothetical protein